MERGPRSRSRARVWRAGSDRRAVKRTRLVVVLALASAVSAARLPAQCADGSPPPCGRPAARPAPPAANSVAVLYFEARDTVDAYLADGLTEDLTSLLGSVPRVQVKSPGVVRRAQRASPGDAPAIARALGVRYLVDGNVRRIGTRVRVAARLVNGATAVAAWGDVFDRTPDELLVLPRSEEHTSELQSQSNLVCRLLLEKKKKTKETAAAYGADRLYKAR